jgi:hypothetical protein
MNSPNDVIVHSLSVSKFMVRRFTEDLKQPEYLHRPTPKANCAAWLLGHLTLTDQRALQRLGATSIPELPAGFDKTFGRDNDAPQCSEFGDVSTLLPTFEKMRDALIAAVQSAPLELLNKPAEKPFPQFKTIGEFANFMAIHTMVHVGQITIIRRSLGYPPIV